VGTEIVRVQLDQINGSVTSRFTSKVNVEKAASVGRAAKQDFIDWPTDASRMRRQLSPAPDIAFDLLW
jgi:hypothetical protein